MKRLSALFLSLLIIFPLIAGAIPVNAHNADNIEDVEAKYFDVKPVIDGYISEAEWGEATVWVRQKPDDPSQTPTTAGDQVPYPNRFFYGTDSYDAEANEMEYFLWLRWDENYFYIGAKVYDPDGHSLKNGRANTWNGDALQVKIDPNGANGICYGDTFYPEYYTDHKPWSSASVCDLVFGYVQGAGGYKEAWNNTKNHNKSMLLNSSYTMANGFVDMAVAPAGIIRNEKAYSTDTANGITTYEIAVPWKYIDFDRTNGHEYYKFALKQKTDADGVITQGPNGAIGYEYGMSAVLLNADGKTGSNSYNALLTWGSGIASRQHMDDSYKTCAGSNAVTLVADKVSEDSLYSSDFTTYMLGGPSNLIPEADYDSIIDPSVYRELTYDDAADMNTFGDSSNGERVQLDDGNWVVKWDKATDRDLPDEATGEMPVYNGTNYLSTEGNAVEGSRYESTGNSFTFEFDVMVTGTEEFQKGYAPALYNWFGGTSSVDYQCGYFFDEGKFKIVNFFDPTEVLAEAYYDLTLNEWHHWVFQYDNDTCALRFYIDPDMVGDRVSRNAYPIFELSYRYFDYGSIESTLLILRRMNVQMMVDNVKMYNFVDFTSPLPSYPLGDVDGDRLITLSDILKVRLYLAGEIDETELNAGRGDVNRDGMISMSDILYYRKYLAGIITSFSEISGIDVPCHY